MSSIEPVMQNSLMAELLLPVGMAAARAALLDNYEWFTHSTAIDNFIKIKANGQNPGRVCPIEVREALGKGSENVVCLQPSPRKKPLLLMKFTSGFLLAVNRTWLPQRIGVDWSFTGWRQALFDIRQAHPALSIDALFLAHIQDREAFVSYDQIPTSVLRVRSKFSAGATPKDWPELGDTELSDVYELCPNVAGNIVLAPS